MNGAQPWSRAGCTYPGCATEDTVSLSVVGRRCERHPPQFDPQRAVDLWLDGFPETASAYCRSPLPLGPIPRPRQAPDDDDPLDLPKPLTPWLPGRPISAAS